jgi:molecular chaperone DnaK
VQVISTNGDTHLGGDDIDHLIVDWLVAEFRKESGIDVSNDKMVLQRLKDASEQAKIELSSVQETSINLPFLTADAMGPKHLQKRLGRARLEQMMKPLVDRTMEPVKKALEDAKRSPDKIDEVVLVGGSTRIPMVHETVQRFFAKEPHKGVNPDEVVAVGAAVQAGVLTGEVKELVLLDVTPLSLGVETLGGVMTTMIARNTTIPAQKKETFSTATDNQPSVEVHVLQGERAEARYNRTLGRFHLDGVLPAPRGVPKIEVAFDIDANGILSVHAKDVATGKDQRITITASGGLSDADIRKMVQEASRHEADDKRRRDEIERRNKLDILVYTLEKTLADSKDKLAEADVTALQGAIQDAREANEKQDDALVTSALDRLEKESHRIAAFLYEKSGAAGQAGPGAAAPPESGPGAAGREGVIDAEFEEDEPKRRTG